MTDSLQRVDGDTSVQVLPPATGAWREGDPVGGRHFVDLGAVTLESGATLPDVRVAYETWGRFDGTNAVLVLHALTGDSHVTGDPGLGHPTPGWWSAIIGPGRAIDTDRWFVVAPNVLGGCQGTTGPASPGPDGRPWGSRFPRTTVRDQVAVEERFADAVGIDRWAAVLGGSMGGMRALEWAVMAPERVERLLLLCSPAAASADQIAWAAPRSRRSARTRVGAVATTTTARAARARTPGSASPGGSRTTPTGRARSTTRASDAGPSRVRIRRTAGASRSRATSTTTPRSSSTASTPAATSR